MTQHEPFARVLKRRRHRPARHLPRFARTTFRTWFARRPARPRAGRRVILWPDTFNNHFHPETARAAVEVLERAGYQVDIPARGSAAAGRSTTGACSTSRGALLRTVVDALRAEIAAGTPVVGPRAELRWPSSATSCAESSPDDPTRTVWPAERQLRRVPGAGAGRGRCPAAAARRSSRGTATTRRSSAWTPSSASCRGWASDSRCRTPAAAAWPARSASRRTLRGLDAGRRARAAARGAGGGETSDHADGFSCREQIAQATGRRALHLADVVGAGARDGRA